VAAAVIGLRAARRGPAVAGAAIALGGCALALATQLLALADRVAAPGYTLAGLDVGSSLIVRSLVQTVSLITLSFVAAIVIWRRPKTILSLLLFQWVAFSWLHAFAAEYALHGLLVAPGSLPFAEMAAWSEKFAPDLALVGAALFMLLFPNGRLKSPRWRWLVALVILVAASDMLIGLDDPYPLRVGTIAQQLVPATLPPVVWPIGAVGAFASDLVDWTRQVVTAAIAAYLVWRLVSASGVERLQLKWFAYAGTVLIVTVLLQLADNPPPLNWLSASAREVVDRFVVSETAHAISSWSSIGSQFTAYVVLPIAVAIAIVRYRLYDIDVVINRTILYGGLAVFVTAAYVIVVAGAGSLLGQRAGLDPLLTVFAIALVAALLIPVRSRLQALANVMVYGKRARPYDVLSDFAGSISRAESADVLLPRMAALLREGTGASRTQVWVRLADRLQLAASSPDTNGTRASAPSIPEVMSLLGPEARAEPVFHGGELLGALVLVKPHGEELTSVEARLFQDLASQAGLVLVRFRLVQELRDSRSRIVAAQDVERRRIERNLHDGAQQRFVNALLALGMAEAGMSGDRSREQMVDEASREIRAGLNELRNLARGLEPPLLAEAGIVAAVSDLADRALIPTSVDAGAVGRHADSIESAAYFVVAEALTNAAKHSNAAAIRVRLWEDAGWLRVEVSDDGNGGANPSRGSGITGLRDRIAALGGRLTIESPAGGGTLLSAELPCE
jgi:signal transduction histidine kinase